MPDTYLLVDDKKLVNLSVYPGPDEKILTNTEITLGDLHGNTIKLLYTLVRNGVTEISPEDYRTFVKIYSTPVVELTRAALDELELILQRIQLKNNPSIWRLIGDEIGDRGCNDYFTLKLFERLKQLGVATETLVSNHGIEFLWNYESAKLVPKDCPGLIAGNYFVGNLLSQPEEFASSMVNLGILIARGLITQKEVEELIENVYKPQLKLLSYTITSDTPPVITIFTHAPVGLETVSALAKHYDVDYHDEDVFALARTIDLVNQAFQKSLQNNTFIPQLIEESYAEEATIVEGMSPLNSLTCPHLRLSWNREDHEHPEYHISFGAPKPYGIVNVHGHTGPDGLSNYQSPENISFVNLDTFLGKAPDDDHDEQEGYCVLHTKSVAPPRPTKIVEPTPSFRAQAPGLFAKPRSLPSLPIPIKRRDEPGAAPIEVTHASIQKKPSSLPDLYRPILPPLKKPWQSAAPGSARVSQSGWAFLFEDLPPLLMKAVMPSAHTPRKDRKKDRKKTQTHVTEVKGPGKR